MPTQNPASLMRCGVFAIYVTPVFRPKSPHISSLVPQPAAYRVWSHRFLSMNVGATLAVARVPFCVCTRQKMPPGARPREGLSRGSPLDRASLWRRDTVSLTRVREMWSQIGQANGSAVNVPPVSPSNIPWSRSTGRPQGSPLRILSKPGGKRLRVGDAAPYAGQDNKINAKSALRLQYKIRAANFGSPGFVFTPLRVSCP